MRLVWQLVAVAALPLYGWVVRRTERRAVVELSREGVGTALGGGTALGVAVCGLVVVNLWFLGHYHAEGLGSRTGANGDFGSEGSPYSVVLCALTACAFPGVARRRGRLLPPRGRRGGTGGPYRPSAPLITLHR